MSRLYDIQERDRKDPSLCLFPAKCFRGKPRRYGLSLLSSLSGNLGTWRSSVPNILGDTFLYFLDGVSSMTCSPRCLFGIHALLDTILPGSDIAALVVEGSGMITPTDELL